MAKLTLASIWLIEFLLIGCTQSHAPSDTGVLQPKEMIDLGALVTEDLPQRVWGKARLAVNDLDRLNVFDVIEWTADIGGESLIGSNSFFTVASHGGPHVDAPIHVGLGFGIDGYPLEAFSGPLKVFDVGRFPKGRSVTRDVFTDASVSPGDVVMIYTGYLPPQTDEAHPETITLTRDAAEFLAEVPVRAFATDAWSIANLQDQSPVESEDPLVRAVPIHHSFLSRGIPVYEQLFNVDQTLGKERMYFVGVPLNIRDGDGMIVRPVVFVY